MEKFVLEVAPPAPQTDISVTLDDLVKHPELYYQVCRSGYLPVRSES
jgi:hypothetical protein